MFETLILHLESAKANCFTCVGFNAHVTTCIPVNLYLDSLMADLNPSPLCHKCYC